MPKKRRVSISRVVGNQVMTSADLERLHKYMLEIEGIDHISDASFRELLADPFSTNSSVETGKSAGSAQPNRSQDSRGPPTS